ncbi:hypothetical protein L9F63_000598, partial [Diploptera punctata]
PYLKSCFLLVFMECCYQIQPFWLLYTLFFLGFLRNESQYLYIKSANSFIASELFQHVLVYRASRTKRLLWAIPDGFTFLIILITTSFHNSAYFESYGVYFGYLQLKHVLKVFVSWLK